MNQDDNRAVHSRRHFIRAGATMIAWLALVDNARATPATPPTPRRHHALLIGVSEYPTLGRRQQLAGPKNDITAWLRYFAKHEAVYNADCIDVVADGVAFLRNRLPTRANIIAALDAAVERAKPDDFQMVYFAGHGSQMAQLPDAKYPEADGLDEIFLARDIGRWDGNVGRVTNAIIDDEIGDRLDAMRTKGMDVFAVFDCCHAATMARADSGSRTRAVSAMDLGIPHVAAPRQVRTAGVNSTSKASKSDANSGALTVFYAAHGHEAATEEYLPRVPALKKLAQAPTTEFATPAWRGVFSFHLIEALSELRVTPSNFPALRALAREVSKRYAHEQRVTPQPRYEFLSTLKF